MPMPMKPTPLRFCEFCAKPLERKRFPSGALECLTQFNQRKYCNQVCMAQAFDLRHSEQVTWSTAHYHARKLIQVGPCERCSKPNARDVHHRDGNHLNNSLENLERICRTCHNLHHRETKTCMLCGAPHKGLGYCDKHYQRFKKYCDPLMFKRNQHAPLVRVNE